MCFATLGDKVRYGPRRASRGKLCVYTSTLWDNPLVRPCSNGPGGLPIPKFRPNYRGRSLHSNCHFQLSLTVIPQVKHDLPPHWPAQAYLHAYGFFSLKIINNQFFLNVLMFVIDAGSWLCVVSLDRVIDPSYWIDLLHYWQLMHDVESSVPQPLWTFA